MITVFSGCYVDCRVGAGVRGRVTVTVRVRIRVMIMVGSMVRVSVRVVLIVKVQEGIKGSVMVLGLAYGLGRGWRGHAHHSI